MKSNITKHLLTAALAGSLLASCGTDFGSDVDDFEASAGDADFTSFIALGDSLTAGYADGALYRHGQENSYPAILAQQFALVGGGEFNQPLMPVGATGSLNITPVATPVDLGRPDRRVLVPTGNPASPATPGFISPTQSTAIDVRIAGAGTFNNLGVPGAKSFHASPLATGYGELTFNAIAVARTSNPYFARFASSDATSLIADAAAQVPTFFVLWLGNNDVLLFALDGADPTVSGETITPTGTFDAAYAAILATLTAAPGTKGVLINVPDVAAIPYFTTVPINSIPLDAATAALINMNFTGYNNAIAASGIPDEEKAARTINFVAGNNPVLILDEDLTTVGVQPNLRLATANDFIVLPAATKIGVDSGGQYGITVPLADLDVLTATEKAAIDVARQAYNATIKDAADMNANLVFLDAEALLNELNTTGLIYGSGGISSTFGQGGGFSLDGVHPTARGYAVIANEIIKVINEGFNANIPPVDPSEYTTVFYQ